MRDAERAIGSAVDQDVVGYHNGHGDATRQDANSAHVGMVSGALGQDPTTYWYRTGDNIVLIHHANHIACGI